MQFKSAASTAMRIHQKSQRDFPRKKSVPAFPASPRSNFCYAINKIRSASPTRSRAIMAVALGTNQFYFLRGDAHFQNMPAATPAQELRNDYQLFLYRGHNGIAPK